MSNSKMLAAKFEFEYLGKSLQEITASYGFPLALLNMWSQEQSWSVKLTAQSLPETSDITTFATALEARTRAQLTVIALFRQIEQQPLLAQIEHLILEKTVTVLANITELDDKAANKILSLVNAVASLRQQNPIELADKVKDAAAQGGITVNIQTNIT
jgi:hypothetical protein